MKKRSLKKKNLYIAGILLLAVIVLLGIVLWPQEPLTQVKLGVIRGEKSEEEYALFASSLQEHLLEYEETIQVTIHYYESDKELINALEKEIVQIAFVSGVGEAMYGSDEKAVVAAENVIEYRGEYYPYYTSVLLKREYEGEDEFLNRDDPSSLHYCILSSNSLAGYIFVMPYFEEMNMYLKDMGNVTKLENYSQGFEMLASGECEVSVGYLGSLEDYHEVWSEWSGSTRKIEQDLRVIYVSDKIYSNAVLVSKEIQKRKDLRQSIIDFLLMNNYSESTYDNYKVMKERIQSTLGGMH